MSLPEQRSDGLGSLPTSQDEEALELLAFNHVQVMICCAPGQDSGGVELLDPMRDMHSSTLGIVVNGSSEIEEMTHAINYSGIHRYYTSPWQPEQVRTDVREAFRQYWLLQDEVGSRQASRRGARTGPGGRVVLLPTTRSQGNEPGPAGNVKAL